MNNKKNINIIVFGISLLFACFFGVQLVKAETLPAKYNMSLKFDVATKTLNGKEDVFITNSSGKDLKNLVFHLYADSYNKKETMPAFGSMGNNTLTEEQKGDITITDVTINSGEVKFTQDNELLKINLDNLFRNNDNLKVSIDFKLKMPMGTNRLGYTEDVYSFTNWYPILSMYDPNVDKWDENSFNPIGESNYSDVSDYNVSLNVPKDFVVASTGKEASENSCDNTKTLKLNASNVRDFVFIMSPRFKVLSKKVNGIDINSYYFSNGETSNSKDYAEKVLDTAASAVKFFESKFGKYPYDNLDMVETYLSGGAMEYPELVQLPNYPQSIDNSNAEFNAEGEDLSEDYENSFADPVVHEVGHQWWYVTVGDNEFKESFLDESITVFSTAYYFEKTDGEYSLNSVNGSLRRRISYDGERGNSDEPSINSSVDKFKNLWNYEDVIYGKGPLVFEDLRKQVGEDKFLDILQTYFNQYKFKNGSINGFLDIIEKKAGKSVRDYIDTCLNSKNYNPQNLKLSNEENEKLTDEQLKERIKNDEKQEGLVLGSIYLRLMNGEKVIVVTPSNLSKDDADSLASIPDKGNLKNLVIKKDKDLTDDDLKNNNLILIGNPWNNTVLNSMNQSLPVNITKTGVYTNNLSIRGSDISGNFIAKNPKNIDKLVLVSFGTKKNDSYKDISLHVDTQFFIYVDGKQYYYGGF